MNKQLQSQRVHALEVLLCPRVLESGTSDSGSSVFVMQTPYKEVVDEDVGYWFQIRSKSVRVLDLYIVNFCDIARQVVLVQVL